MSIQAIETSYKGYRFRSRLEARWAVFFDALKVEYCDWADVVWEYEPEGFDIEGVRYLPDFKVTYKRNRIVWFEVKADLRSVTQDEWHKLVSFAWALRPNCPDLCPGEYSYKTEVGYAGDEYEANYYGNEFLLLDGVPEVKLYRTIPELLRTKKGHFVTPYEVIPNSFDPGRSGNSLWCGDWDIFWSAHTKEYDWYKNDTLIRAVNAAKSARFEFGESG